MSEKDGGPAFPMVDTEPAMDNDTREIFGRTYSTNGMALRDYFAAKALGGIFANPNTYPSTEQHFNNIAEDAYKAANAMLKAREQ
jgi:hypothetical protein